MTMLNVTQSCRYTLHKTWRIRPFVSEYGTPYPGPRLLQRCCERAASLCCETCGWFEMQQHACYSFSRNDLILHPSSSHSFDSPVLLRSLALAFQAVNGTAPAIMGSLMRTDVLSLYRPLWSASKQRLVIPPGMKTSLLDIFHAWFLDGRKSLTS